MWSCTSTRTPATSRCSATGRRWHVFINHGESDKMYMTTNQFKAYDYALVAGDAARERLSRVLWDYDVETRTIEIGRPQTTTRGLCRTCPTSARWCSTRRRGGRPSLGPLRVDPHARRGARARAVLTSPAHRLLYRPHPRSGVVDPEYGAANDRIVAAIAAANAADPSPARVRHGAGARLAARRGRRRRGRHLGDGVRPARRGPAADDHLAGDPEALIDTHGYLSHAEWLTADAAPRIVEEVAQLLFSDPAAVSALEGWVRHYFGDTSPGAATARFEAAIGLLMSVGAVARRGHR